MKKLIWLVVIATLILMPSITWDDLAKNQDDPETIEEAITRIVGQHNDDATSHLGDGQSLQSHRASEIIDHRIGSIDSSKESWKELRASTVFESIDAWLSSGGTPVLQVPGVQINSVYPAYPISELYSPAQVAFDTGALEAGYVWQASVYYDFDVNANIYMGAGNDWGTSGFFGVGFHFSDTGSWAVVGDENGVRETPIVDPGGGEIITYRIQAFDEEPFIRFYINGTEAATDTFSNSGDPGDLKPFFMTKYTGSTSAPQIDLIIFNLLFSRNL